MEKQIIDKIRSSERAYFALSTLINIFPQDGGKLTIGRIFGYLQHVRMIEKLPNGYCRLTAYGKSTGYFHEVAGDSRIYLSGRGLIMMIECIINGEVWTD